MELNVDPEAEAAIRDDERLKIAAELQRAAEADETQPLHVRLIAQLRSIGPWRRYDPAFRWRRYGRAFRIASVIVEARLYKERSSSGP